MIPGQFKRSGGPKTPEGKATASQNSLKLGAYSKHVIVTGEDEAQFNDLLNQLIREYEPIGMTECALVRDIAVHIWRKLRYEKLESAFFNNAVYQYVQSLEMMRSQMGSELTLFQDQPGLKQAIIDERLLGFFLKGNSQRAVNDMNRSLCWLVSELRKHQDWRKTDPKAPVFLKVITGISDSKNSEADDSSWGEFEESTDENSN